MKTLPLLLSLIALATAHVAAQADPRWDWNYRVKLSKDTGGLNIAMHASNGPAVVVGLKNNSTRTVLCRGSFVSYAHQPAGDEIVSVTVAPGKSATLAYPAHKLGPPFSTAFVDVKCRAK